MGDSFMLLRFEKDRLNKNTFTYLGPLIKNKSPSRCRCRDLEAIKDAISVV